MQEKLKKLLIIISKNFVETFLFFNDTCLRMAVDEAFEELVKLYQNTTRVYKKILALADFQFSEDDKILLKKIREQLAYSYDVLEEILKKCEREGGE